MSIHKKKQIEQHLIMGCNCIEELVKHNPKRIIKVYAQKQDNLQKRKQSLIAELQSENIEIQYLPKHELDRICDSTSHQGFAASLKNKDYTSIKEFLNQDKDQSIVVMLDSIYDPHNVGAILRGCECFGVDLVVWSKNRSCPLSTTVTKTSSSASEFIPIAQVSNLAHTLKEFQDNGYEAITADVGENSKSLYDFKFPRKSLVIMGSEGEGVQPLLIKNAEHSVYIPMKGIIDSLNVSQATAVLLSKYIEQN